MRLNATLCTLIVLAIFFQYPASAEENIGIKLEDVDTNQDGTVSSEEASSYLDKLDAEYKRKLEELKRLENERLKNAKIPVLFNPADFNKDGVVSPEEQERYLALSKPVPKDTPEEKTTTKQMALEEDVPEFLEKKYTKRLNEMAPNDLNKDGVLQAEELAKKVESDFANADRDEDGVLSPDEMELFRQQIKEQSLKAYDSKSQANQDSMKFKNYYQQADKNDDDIVSQEEYEAYFKGRYQKFDRDGDGIISQGEYRSDFEKLPWTYRRDKQKEEND